MVRGDCKSMSPEFIQGASFTNYGTTLYVGIGVPIPILNEDIVRKVSIRDEEIFTDIVDYGTPRRDRPTLGKVNYKDLKSGRIVIKDREVKVSPLSSLKKALEIAESLKSWIEDASFLLSAPVENLPTDTVFKPMRQTRDRAFVENLVHEAVTCTEDEKIEEVAQRLISHSVNHIVVIDENESLRGVVTSWDITRAIAEGKENLRDIIVRRVITTNISEPVEAASLKMAQHDISALPVVDRERKVLGIITSEDISRLFGGGRYG
jgi:CBS domain-containing protein